MHLFLHLLLHQHPQGMLLLLVHAQLLSQHYHRSYIPAVDVKQFPDTKNFVSFHCCTIIATPRTYTEILVARTLYSCKQCTTLQGCLATLQQTLATLETGVARTVRQSPVIAPDLHPFHIHRRYVRSMALLMICAKLLISFNGRGITW